MRKFVFATVICLFCLGLITTDGQAREKATSKHPPDMTLVDKEITQEKAAKAKDELEKMAAIISKAKETAVDAKTDSISPQTDQPTTTASAKVIPEKPSTEAVKVEPAKAEPKTKPKEKTATDPVKTKVASVPKKTTKKSNGIGPKIGTDSQKPIKITSKRLEADDSEGTVTFTGTVVAVQGSTTLKCDRMIVFYSKEGDTQNAQRDLAKIEVEGHVIIDMPDQTAYGRKGIYELKENRIILEGKPKIVQGDNTIIGDKIIVYLKDNRAVVEGGLSHVEAVIVPNEIEYGKGNDGGSSDAGGGSGGAGVAGGN